MSREIDTTVQLSQEEWLAMRSHIVALMKGAKEEALRTSLGGIIFFLTEYPEARDRLSELLCNASATTFSNGLLEFVTTAQRKAFERAIWKGTCLLEGGYAEWEELDENGNFWSWCYQGCDDHQKEEVAKYLGQRLHFLDGSTLHGRYVKGNLNARALLEDLLKEIVLQSVRYSTADEIETGNSGHALLDKAQLKSKRRTHFLSMLALAHGDPRRSPLPSEGSPLSGASAVSDAWSPDNDQSVGDSPSSAPSQEEEAKRRMSSDNEPTRSSKQPKVAECRDYGAGCSPSQLESEHQEEPRKVSRAGTPHPKKGVDTDRVSRPRRCKQVVRWLRCLSRQFRASFIHTMPCLKKLGKKTRPEPPEFELEDRRKDSSQSRSPGFRGGAGFNLRKRRKTGSPAALSSTTKDSLHLASEPTAASELDMVHELPNATLNSAALLKPRTNKSSPHSILEQASLSRSSTSKDSPHSSPRSIGRPKPQKTQEHVDGGDREF